MYRCWRRFLPCFTLMAQYTYRRNEYFSYLKVNWKVNSNSLASNLSKNANKSMQLRRVSTTEIEKRETTQVLQYFLQRSQATSRRRLCSHSADGSREKTVGTREDHQDAAIQEIRNSLEWINNFQKSKTFKKSCVRLDHEG